MTGSTHLTEYEISFDDNSTPSAIFQTSTSKREDENLSLTFSQLSQSINRIEELNPTTPERDPDYAIMKDARDELDTILEGVA